MKEQYTETRGWETIEKKAFEFQSLGNEPQL